MRILLVGLNYAPELAGIGPYTTGLAEHFAARGHSVTVLTGFPFYPQWRVDERYRNRGPFLVEEINGVRIIRSPVLLPGDRHRAFRRILFDSSVAATSLISSARIGATDVVICVSPPLQLGLTSWLVARSRAARFLLHLQDIVPDAALSVGMMHEGLAIQVSRRLERAVYSAADHITVITKGFYSNLVGKGVPREKVHVLPNWVDTQQFSSKRNLAVRAALGGESGGTLALHTGNMGAKQGLETVVDAAAELANDNVALTLIGDGSRRRDLEARANRLGLSRLKFMPLQKDLPATLAAADVLLLAQLGRVIDSVAPSKLLSYMASGRPVVASVNELSEAGRIVREAGCGLVVPPDDPKALAAAVRSLHRHPEGNESLGKAGLRYATEHYERSSVLDEWSLLVEAQSRRSL